MKGPPTSPGSTAPLVYKGQRHRRGPLRCKEGLTFSLPLTSHPDPCLSHRKNNSNKQTEDRSVAAPPPHPRPPCALASTVIHFAAQVRRLKLTARRDAPALCLPQCKQTKKKQTTSRSFAEVCFGRLMLLLFLMIADPLSPPAPSPPCVCVCACARHLPAPDPAHPPPRLVQAEEILTDRCFLKSSEAK